MDGCIIGPVLGLLEGITVELIVTLSGMVGFGVEEIVGCIVFGSVLGLLEGIIVEVIEG